ncbi:MAG TPA: XTP/dITP diphosphatase [Firmicutes bacterium]|nr:XTP/dITP diphosphatase [Bacillota bacterium]
MLKLVLASRNKGKITELRWYLANMCPHTIWELSPLSAYPEAPEVEEDGETFRDNAVKKATVVAKAVGEWALADDSGLEVDALGGAPGVYSARYAGLNHLGERDDQKNNEKLLTELVGVPLSRRTARFKSVIALASPEGKVWTAEGSCEGYISLEPRGERGFGYDPLFYLPEYGLTMAELTEEEKNRISHRARAMEQFLRILTEVEREINSKTNTG